MKIQTQKLKSTHGFWLLIVSALLAIPCASFAQQVVIGSWQNNSDDGWIQGNNGLSITNTANMPSGFQFEPNVVLGYTQSLSINEAGYGSEPLEINLTALGSAAMAAFTNGTQLQFTFSCPTNSATAGYMQMVQFQYNSPGSGGTQTLTPSTANGFSETGATGNNSAGQPIYYFPVASGSSARSQVVTWDYSTVKSNILSGGLGYIQLTFKFQTGGGAPTNVLMNNVVLLGPPAAPGATQSIVVDDFVPAGVSPANPANYDYFNNAQVYSSGQISNVWRGWFGNALSSVIWDSTTDASNNLSSGSMQVNLNWNNDTQFVLYDIGTNYFNLNVSGYQYTNLQCDVKFAPGSASSVGNGSTPGGQPIFGHLRFGNRTASYGQDWFGAVDIAATNTGWVHVSIPINAVADPNLTNLNNILIGIDSSWYNLNLTTNNGGLSSFWVDNIQFVGPAAVVSISPPTLSIQPATPGLRIFAGSTANTYDREELTTVDQQQSWVGGSYPVTYSFKLLSAPSLQGWQTHMFLIPTASVPSSQTVYGNEYVEYQASNNLWLQISGSTNGMFTANVSWKTNLPNSNPTNVAINITNSTAVGTWTVKFSDASHGTLTAPGASPVPFTINDANVSTDFANPLVAVFGIQPQSAAYYGSYVDYANINISGVAGNATSDDFTTETSLGANWDLSNSAYQNSIVLVTAGNPYWVNWTLPDSGFGLGSAPDLQGSTWYTPSYYGNYYPIPVVSQEGNNRWALMPANYLPTMDTTQGGVISPNGFFRLFNPPLAD